MFLQCTGIVYHTATQYSYHGLRLYSTVQYGTSGSGTSLVVVVLVPTYLSVPAVRGPGVLLVPQAHSTVTHTTHTGYRTVRSVVLTVLLGSSRYPSSRKQHSGTSLHFTVYTSSTARLSSISNSVKLWPGLTADDTAAELLKIDSRH